MGAGDDARGGEVLIDKGETQEEFEDVVAVCRQCIMQQESVPPQQYGARTRKAMTELCLCMVCAMEQLSDVPVSHLSRLECEESILPLRIALEYRPKAPFCLHELGMRLNCLSRHTWDPERIKSLERERDEVMAKAATGGYGSAIVAVQVRRLLSGDKYEAERAESALTALANHGLFEAGVALIIRHRTQGREEQAREAMKRCVAAGAKELEEVAEDLQGLPAELPPGMPADFLYSSLLG